MDLAIFLISCVAAFFAGGEIALALYIFSLFLIIPFAVAYNNKDKKKMVAIIVLMMATYIVAALVI